MRQAAAFGLLALVPAALGAPPPAAAAHLSVLLCGEGPGRIIDLPISPPPAHQREQCPKACHAGCSRKRPSERSV